MKLIDYLYEWLDSYQKTFIKKQTYIRYKSNIRTYIEKYPIAQKEYDKITRKEIQQYINSLYTSVGDHTKKYLSARTVHNVYVLLHSAYSYAEDYELIEKSPCFKIKKVKCQTVNTKIQFLSVEEQRRIETYIDTSEDYELYGIMLDLYSGLRIGELCSLTWDDVDFDKRTITINKGCYNSIDDEGNWTLITDTPKTISSNRVIPIPKHIIEMLKDKKAHVKGKYVCSFNDGTQMTPWSCRYRYEKVLKILNIKHLKFHCLRHTFATRAIERKMDVRTLADILGHTDPSITLKVYTHSSFDNMRKSMDQMERL